MAALGIVIGVLALVATIWALYYARGQLVEAKAIREESNKATAAQMEEDNLWAEKYVKAGNLLCRIADHDRFSFFPGRVVHLNGALSVLFEDDIRRRILGQLIERQDDNSYALRPFDIAQLRLKPTRDLIDLVLARIEKFRGEKSNQSSELGL